MMTRSDCAFPTSRGFTIRAFGSLRLMRAARAKTAIRRGVYCGVNGPELETSAERRFFRSAGGDAVGMSTVTEVIAANHAGMKVLGLSAVANAATGGPDQQPDTIESVFAVAAICGEKIAAILKELLPALPAHVR